MTQVQFLGQVMTNEQSKSSGEECEMWLYALEKAEQTLLERCFSTQFKTESVLLIHAPAVWFMHADRVPDCVKE